MHWSDSHIEFICRIVPELSDTPIYVLRIDESPMEWDDQWMAAFAPLADLQAQTALEQLGLWQGRGICIRVRDDFETWSNRCKAGTLLHEVAHGIEHLSQDDALCPMASLSPVAREMLTGSESQILQEAGISRNDLIREQHGPDFVRYAMHLFWRARTQIPLAASDVQFLHGAYSMGSERFEAVTEALSYELARSRNLNLTRLREAPEAFMEMFT